MYITIPDSIIIFYGELAFINMKNILHIYKEKVYVTVSKHILKIMFPKLSLPELSFNY